MRRLSSESVEPVNFYRSRCTRSFHRGTSWLLFFLWEDRVVCWFNFELDEINLKPCIVCLNFFKIIKVIERWWKKQFVSRHGVHVARDSHDPIIHAAMVEALLHCNVSFVARDGWISIRSPRSSFVSLNFLSTPALTIFRHPYRRAELE